MNREDYDKEIERLNNKIRNLSVAYSQSTMELEQLKGQIEPRRRRGRPALNDAVKARVVSLYEQGDSMRTIAAKTGAALGSVHKIVTEAMEKARIVYVYMDGNCPGTIIDANGVSRDVRIWNLSDDMIQRAFGANETPKWEDFTDFLEDRCMPRTRYGIKQELKSMHLDAYDPFQIIDVTQGRVYGDSQWLLKPDKDWIEQYDGIIKSSLPSEQKGKKLKQLMER